MSTPTIRAQLRNRIFRLGSEPQKSWGQFRLGLVVFAAGAAFILFGPALHVWLQIPGLILVAVGFIWAGKGYLGIFANRFAQSLNRVAEMSWQDKQNIPPK